MNVFIDAAIDAYTKAYPNLKMHDPNYPTPDFLKSKIPDISKTENPIKAKKKVQIQ